MQYFIQLFPQVLVAIIFVCELESAVASVNITLISQ